MICDILSSRVGDRLQVVPVRPYIKSDLLFPVCSSLQVLKHGIQRGPVTRLRMLLPERLNHTSKRRTATSPFQSLLL